jgi:hypothetical protein
MQLYSSIVGVVDRSCSYATELSCPGTTEYSVTHTR